FAVPQDWTIGAPEALVLWFYGDPNNAVTEQMYVKINGDKVIYEGDADNMIRQRWTQWNIDLASPGVSMSNVTSLSLGFERTGAFGGSGIVFIDDIRLYKTPPPELLPVDPGNNGLVAHFKLDEGAGTTFTDSSGYGHDATIEPPNEGLVRWTTNGYEGAALEFTTAFEEPYTFVDAPLTPGLLNIEQATYAFWMKMPPAHQPWGIIFDLIGEQTDYSLEPSDAGELYNYVPWFGNTQVQVNNDQWHHVAVTFSNAEDLTVIYVNGAEIARGSSSGSEAITTVRIGGPRANAEVWASFTGILDEIHIFNRALSEGEILYLSNQ
ncbi:MAG: LamG domain-containing protein, partial [Dehalococcoidia bacterium]|nr:LamG domain-containing protein [Dehalococcoidia bacterium]